MLVCSTLALRGGNSEFIMYAVVMVFFIAGLMLLHLRIRFTHSTLWLLTIWGFLHMCGGTVPIPPEYTDAFRAAQSPENRPTSAVLYSLRIHPDFFKYDQLVHAFGFFSATIASYEALKTLLKAPPTTVSVIIAALMGIGLGALNEVIEFAAVLTMPKTNVGGYINTGWDLVANTLGAALGAIWSLKRKHGFQESS
jgi:uncharacterized membrane protein YjdF